MIMLYEEFKARADIEWEKKRQEMQRKGNIAYNKGLWDAIKWNPFKWYAYLIFKRAI
jgi:hypothetical protein